ncbi:MAG: hypothetical protein O3A95_04200 [Planctomycetota bacterium]|nr:hypothetical protein [Planctomycetota bacterium]MDA1113485.1 hypothetical protein [Planctomycetota bacterium]
MTLSSYRLVFFAGFLLIPGAIWGVQVNPTLVDRTSFVQRQENAKTVQAANKLLPTQRDSLNETWTDFHPVADDALANIANDLNPHLVQKRLYDTAEELNCDLRIQPKPALDGDTSVRFLISGEGSYPNLVKLVDRLEQGQHFVRFENLQLTIPSQDYSRTETGAVRIVGLVQIPMMPKGLKVKDEASNG